MDSAGAEGPDTLPPRASRQDGRGEGAGAEGPETPSQAPPTVHSRVAARTGAEGPEMRQRDPTACGEGGPPQRPARPLVLAADAIRPLGMASILLPSAAELPSGAGQSSHFGTNPIAA